MRVLIHGGFGLVGGRLAQHFHHIGHDVVLGSRHVRPSIDCLPGLDAISIDYKDNYSLAKACDGVDLVIQAAGMNASDCFNQPLAAFEANGLGTGKLLDSAVKSNVKRFIYLSTAHVYANPLIGKISESDCTKNLHPYATSHVAGENFVLRATQCGDIEGVVLRLSNAFGVPVSRNVNCWMLLINDLCRQAVSSGKLVLSSNGLQQRNFIALSSLVSCFDFFSTVPSTAIQDGLFNVGSEESNSVYQISKIVADRCRCILGFTPEIERLEPQTNHVADTLNFSVEKLKALGFTAQDEMDSEIDALLLFCKKVF